MSGFVRQGAADGFGSHSERILPRFTGGFPELKVGSRVIVLASGRFPEHKGAVIEKTGYRLRIRTDAGLEFSKRRDQVRRVSL